MIYYFDSFYVIGGLALLFLILLAFLKFMKRKSNMYLLCFSVMYIYLCVVLDLTQFPIYASEGMKAAMGGQNVWREMNLIPLKTIVTDFSMESVLNIIMTIPLGFGLSFLMRCSWRKIMLSGLLVGGCAEAGQLLTALWVGFTFRHVNIDDILLNIIGVLVGYGLFKIFRNVFQWGYKKLETNSNAFLSYIKCVCDENSDALLK
nr:VanZ family protein [uncultured Mediterraneibacter sp.]